MTIPLLFQTVHLEPVVVMEPVLLQVGQLYVLVTVGGLVQTVVNQVISYFNVT